jgi:hypothetical protein
VPSFCTVRVEVPASAAGIKLAVTAFASLMVMVQVAVAPEQAPPQEAKMFPDVVAAERVTLLSLE